MALKEPEHTSLQNLHEEHYFIHPFPVAISDPTTTFYAHVKVAISSFGS